MQTKILEHVRTKQQHAKQLVFIMWYSYERKLIIKIFILKRIILTNKKCYFIYIKEINQSKKKERKPTQWLKLEKGEI